MSFRATEWAYGLRGLTGPEKAVLACLAWHHNGKTGLCCPGNALIAEETCLGLSTVKKALASLVAKGLIDRTPWKGRTAYMLAIVEPERATREPAHIEQETNTKERRSRADFSKWDGRERRPYPPATKPGYRAGYTPTDYRELAEQKAAEFKELIGASAKDTKTEEERAAVVERAMQRLRLGGLEDEPAPTRCPPPALWPSVSAVPIACR